MPSSYIAMLRYIVTQPAKVVWIAIALISGNITLYCRKFHKWLFSVLYNLKKYIFKLSCAWTFGKIYLTVFGVFFAKYTVIGKFCQRHENCTQRVEDEVNDAESYMHTLFRKITEKHQLDNNLEHVF